MNEKLMLQDEEEPPGTPGSSDASHRTEEPTESSADPPLVEVTGINRLPMRPARRSFRPPPAESNTQSIPPLPDPDLPISVRMRRFRRVYFPGVSTQEWNDWNWQLANRITRYAELSRILHLSEAELVASTGSAIPLSITPYYASLMDPDDPAQAIRRTMVPTVLETMMIQGEDEDPLAEEHDTVVPGLVHRYPDRVLFLATDNCSAYCRYCTRSRMVGQRAAFSLEQWERAFAYIQSHREIRDVLVSGGDPLTLPDEVLDWLLARLRQISHVEILRIGTKVPAVLPMRITPKLVRVLKKYQPLWISIHATHPDELTPEMRLACTRLADGGFPLGSQTVLLSGINDSVETMKQLFQGLLTVRVRPYYLYQCDPIPGSSHFRTPVAKGLEIIQGLRGYTSGYAVPHYVIDAPGGGGKIPLLPDYVVGVEEGKLIMHNYLGNRYSYPDGSVSVGV